jgi:outer membrane biosynthesis protein TonB
VIALAAVLLTRGQPQPGGKQAIVSPPPAVEAPVTKPVAKPEGPAMEPKVAAPAPRKPEKKAESGVVAKSVEPAKQQQQQPPPVETAPAPAPTPPPPAPVAPAGKYFGPPEGRFSWAGSLGAGATVTITGSAASAGALQGRGLPPSLEVSVSVDPPSVQVLSQPSAQNGYRLTLKNTGGSEVPAITIRWRERKS